MKVSRLNTAIVILLMLCFTLVGCSNTQEENNGLQISSMQSGIGSVEENNFDRQRYTYSAALVNESDQDMYISLVEPILSVEIKDRVITNNYQEFIDTIAAGETVEIKGEFIFDATGLNKEQIIALEPFITGFRVSTEQILTLPGQESDSTGDRPLSK